jgi:hypothetical protein
MDKTILKPIHFQTPHLPIMTLKGITYAKSEPIIVFPDLYAHNDITSIDKEA